MKMQVDDRLEVSGVSLMNMIRGCGIFQSRIRKKLSERGICLTEDLHTKDWYPLLPLFEVMLDLVREFGSDSIMFEMGKAVPFHSVIPEEIETFEMMLQMMDQAGRINHRNGSAGTYHTDKIDDRKYHVRLETVYPAVFNLGMLRGFSQRFNTVVRIEQLESNLYGGEFIVQW
jgi:hypothetical protein